MGLNLASTLRSRPGFLSSDCTTACLKPRGTTPEDRLFMIARTDCPILGKTSLKMTETQAQTYQELQNKEQGQRGQVQEIR